MKKKKNIHNLDTLEKEIFRLKLETKNIEEKLDWNLEYLQENYSSMFMHSFSNRRKHKEEGKSNLFDSFLKNEGFNSAVNKITDLIADRASEGIDKLIDKLFHSKK